MNKSQAGRAGGLATYAKHGAQHMSAIGKRGARVFWQRYHLVPCDLADFAIVERATGKTINLLYNSAKFLAAQQTKTAMSGDNSSRQDLG
jgi:hypothetical protein